MRLNSDKTLLVLPSSESSVIDCVETSGFTRIGQLRSKSRENGGRQGDRGMLMSLKLEGASQCLGGYENGDLVLFDLRMYREIASVSLFEGQPIMCFDYCASNNVGISGSSESWIKQFALVESSTNSLVEFRLDQQVELVNPGLNCAKIRTSDSKLCATGGWDSRVRLYSLKRLKPLVVLDFHKEAVNTIDFSSENLMACGSNDGIISFWNLYT
jgi:WD40 repeat protein